MKMKKYLKKKNQLRYYEFLVYLKIYNYFKNKVEENICQEFRLKNIDETRNYFLEDNRNHKNFSTTLNYIEHFVDVFQFLHFLLCLVFL